MTTTRRTVADWIDRLENLGQDMTAARRALAGFPELLAVPVSWNPRLRTAAGRAFTREFKPDSRIEMNVRLRAEGPEAERQTFLHELAHVMCSPGAGHGPAWKRALAQLGGVVERTHRYESMSRARRTRKVVGRCDRCSAEIERARELPRGKVYTHTRCGGTIVPAR